MPTTIACPACQAKLKIPGNLLGRQVKCSSCSSTFEARDAATASLDEASAQAPAAPAPRLTGAVEIKLSLDDVPAAAPRSAIPPVPEPPPAREVPSWRSEGWDEKDWRADDDDMRPCPGCGTLLHPAARRCHGCGDRVGRYRSANPDRPRHRQRRDCEPHRGSMILTLGIIGLVLAIFLAPVGAIMSLFAWVMGHGDLVRIREGQMDEDGSESTWAGWLCGIFGTIIGFLVTMSCLSMWAVIYINEHPSTPPGPRFGAPPPPLKKGAPNNPGNNQDW